MKKAACLLMICLELCWLRVIEGMFAKTFTYEQVACMCFQTSEVSCYHRRIQNLEKSLPLTSTSPLRSWLALRYMNETRNLHNMC